MPSPEAARRIVGRLFRADGDHITDLKIPLSTRPVDVVLWHSRVFQYKGTEASGQPVYFEASTYAVLEGRMMLPYVAWIAIWQAMYDPRLWRADSSPANVRKDERLKLYSDV
jgi:hypothetical protein